MQMTDAEILRRYRNAGGARERKQQVSIMAQLNGVDVDVMNEKIKNLLDAEHGKDVTQFAKTQAAVATIKHRKKPGPKPKIPHADAHEALLESVEKPAAGKKKPGRPAKKVPKALIEAAKHECEDIGNAIEQMQREINELSERMKERLAAWGELKEWLQANE